jgi:hypothetical protein
LDKPDLEASVGALKPAAAKRKWMVLKPVMKRFNWKKGSQAASKSYSAGKKLLF